MIKHDHDVLLIKRPNKGLLAGLWGFPILESDQSSDLHNYFKIFIKENFNLNLIASQFIQKKKHVFTHLNWHMSHYELEVLKKESIKNGLWLKNEELKDYAMPTAFKKLI